MDNGLNGHVNLMININRIKSQTRSRLESKARLMAQTAGTKFRTAPVHPKSKCKFTVGVGRSLANF